MCYAIPGNVKSIAENLITIDYFGKERKARNDFNDPQVCDYVYAQGGFVVQKIGEKDAEEILYTCKKLVQKIKAIISSEIRKIPDPNVGKLTSSKMEFFIQGARDLYF